MSNIAYFLAGWFSSWLIYLPPRLTPILNIFFLLSSLPAFFNEISWFHLHFTFTDSYILNIFLMVWISYFTGHALTLLARKWSFACIETFFECLSVNKLYQFSYWSVFVSSSFLKSLFILEIFYTTCFNIASVFLTSTSLE